LIYEDEKFQGPDYVLKALVVFSVHVGKNSVEILGQNFVLCVENNNRRITREKEEMMRRQTCRELLCLEICLCWKR